MTAVFLKLRKFRTVNSGFQKKIDVRFKRMAFSDFQKRQRWCILDSRKTAANYSGFQKDLIDFSEKQKIPDGAFWISERFVDCEYSGIGVNFSEIQKSPDGGFCFSENFGW